MPGAVPVSDTADTDHPALVDPAGPLSYGALAELVDGLAAGLPEVRTGRRLVHIPLAAERDLVLGYLAVLKAGHVALVTPPEHASITAAYPPDMWLREDGTFAAATGGALNDRTGPRYELHPDLALLLSTSGSTGSPKLVRLSHSNLVSNADAIAAALSITPADRAITSLPLHYCFGLSVLHSQLRAGATAVLWHGSVTDRAFADELRSNQVTLLPATPHVVDLLDVQGVLDNLPSLRLLAQAGGGLPPARVRELATRGRADGWGLAVMYGQTEATARMAVLPPELAGRYPDAVGWPIAGSAFRLDPAGIEQPAGADPADGPVGELVFTGPGVMLGYAEHPDDLALGRMHSELRTGDLARINADGVVRIVGRRSDHVKIMGIRIDLGQVERSLRGDGIPCCVTGTDGQLQVTYECRGRESGAIRAQAASAAGLGESVVSVQEVADLPVLPSGKPDRRGCAALHSTNPAHKDAAITADDSLAAITSVLAPLVNRRAIDPDRSFAELGGDSFNHVAASLGLTRLLGDLPPDWHHRPVRDLVALAARRRPARRALIHRVETTVVMRGVAVVTICGSHVGLFRLAGGAHILLAVAGVLFARYVLTAAETTDRVRRTARAAIGVAVPAVVVAALMVFVFRSIHWSNLALVHWLVRPGDINIFWFVEALLMLSAVTTALVAVPRVRAAYAADPWRTAMAALAVLLVPRYLVPALVDGPVRGLPGTVAWLFVAGIAMAVADTRRRRVVTAAVAAAATIGFFPEWERDLIILAGLVLLALLPTVPVPGLLVRPLGVLAAASLHVYLVQFQVFAFVDTPRVQFAAALGVGLVFCAVSTYALRRLPLPGPTGGALIRRLGTAKHSVREV
ncbi:acyl-CoA synthetase (AMP-forming)/AMP-acid ligase II [Kribbella orskensis]|uniref:Acyl-CoA synthetase (AMP-forming)/AMP-acid ligase II n=1 Tax=Kribbella orskensis TaxID=2512216 RepID=A0ABY2BML5_9ACTN|nr:MULTISPECIES: AMP-binding protein [Kribbella]TCN41794.1 acyl-CoA synthetase (AMP-forming)/AMP-acid ligase II [Kribbella sp. VKM Ac-2500]TCO25672.1 acyl-CoA synthetase (AMP-forming)/AMP-acid ligase II [Kribbella orskensis]